MLRRCWLALARIKSRYSVEVGEIVKGGSRGVRNPPREELSQRFIRNLKQPRPDGSGGVKNFTKVEIETARARGTRVTRLCPFRSRPYPITIPPAAKQIRCTGESVATLVSPATLSTYAILRSRLESLIPRLDHSEIAPRLRIKRINARNAESPKT